MEFLLEIAGWIIAGCYPSAYSMQVANSRVQQLEDQSDKLFMLIEKLVDHARTSRIDLPKDSWLVNLMDASQPDRVDQLVVEIDDHVKSGRPTLAKRALHDAGLSWDQVYQALDNWKRFDAGKKRRLIAFARLRSISARANQP